MSARTRRRVQRLALLALGALLVVLGLSRLAGASMFGERHAHPHPERHVERTVERTVELVDVRQGRAEGVFLDETFRVRPGGTLDLDLGSASVTVRTGGGDRARVVVEGRGRDAEREFERRRFSARTDGDRLVVQTDPERRNWRTGRTDARFDVTVEVPRRFDAAIDVGSGSVDVGPLTGDLRVDTGSGSVRVADVDGERVVLDTGSGSVHAHALRGDVEIDTGSGSVRVESVDGELAVDTGSGSVDVGLVRGPVLVDTGSGGVELALAGAAPVEIDTGSGSVSLGLPRDAGFDVAVEASSVRIDEALGFRGRNERGRAEGQIGRGGPDIDVETGSGTVRLRTR
jgi:hypothetical protein